MKKILVTGSGGLVGETTCRHFSNIGWEVLGIENDTRGEIFGPSGSVANKVWEMRDIPNYQYHFADIRDFEEILDIFKTYKPDAVVHTAAQPSHDWAVRDPRTDFSINATGTSNILEAARLCCPEAPFVHISTSKVYGDNPNRLKMHESPLRYDFADPEYKNGIAEDFNIDQCTHSLFGVSKLSGDVLAQEYGRYFDMPVVVLRPGCITGSGHTGVQLHGFLNYMVRAAHLDGEYQIIGYKGKQVRGNIHATDLVRFFECFINKPSVGEVYNIGGGRPISCSVIEALDITEQVIGKEIKRTYFETPRIGDHICYYSDLSKIKRDYPEWEPQIGIAEMIREISDNFKASL